MITVTSAQQKPVLKQTTNVERAPSTWIMHTDKRVPRIQHNAKLSPVLNYQDKRINPLVLNTTGLHATVDPQTNTVISVSGELINAAKTTNLVGATQDYIAKAHELLHIKDPENEIGITSITKDELGLDYIRVQQYYKGYKIDGAEAVARASDGRINLLTGRLIPSLKSVDTNVTLSSHVAHELVKEDLPTFKLLNKASLKYIPQDQTISELVIMPDDNGQYSLDYHVTVYANIAERWEYIINPRSGAIKSKYQSLCKLHDHRHDKSDDKVITHPIMDGSVPTTATDWNGVSRSINVFNCGSDYLLLDAAQSMYSGNNDCSDSDGLLKGAILTLDAKGTSPQNDNFDYDVAASSSASSWSDRVAVSAHYNGLRAYQYFVNTFGRQSINGNGGNIISFVDVAEDDGQDMDNAFWNGSAIFYGNGDQAFGPLAGALDVAGHEMAHGVIQTTANLRYQGESGAMNEAFADIFGAMIDRDDWTLGEDVVNTQIFNSGALRSMSDPHNGGNSLNDNGYQPRTVAEMFMGSADNGGVHINSGIINYAYYLFVTQNANVTKEIAEQVFYRALTQYLISSSKFIDLRIAVMNAAMDLYGESVAQAAASAFAAVGIGSSGQTTTEPEDLEENTGTEFIYYSDVGNSNINNATVTGGDGGVFSTTDHLSKPSISDDGTIMLFVGTDNRIYEIDIDWSTGEIIREFALADEAIFRNVVTSKDGNRLAALTTDNDNNILIYDFILEEWQTFDLYNPTYTQGITTDDVQYADALEFDLSGNNLVYDAYNEVKATNGDDISYWDIGIINIWDNGAWNTGEDNIFKLFTGIPEDVSVGNPSFAKNSPSIIAFDLIDSREAETEYAIYTVNLETNKTGVVYEGNTLGYPNYSVDDTKMIFSFNNSGTEPIIATINLQANKLEASGNPSVFIEDASWAVWFATGTRNLSTSLRDIPISNDGLTIAPNPVVDQLSIYIPADANGKIGLEIFDVLGRKVYQEAPQYRNDSINTDVSGYAAGSYFVLLSSKDAVWTEQIIIE